MDPKIAEMSKTLAAQRPRPHFIDPADMADWKAGCASGLAATKVLKDDGRAALPSMLGMIQVVVAQYLMLKPHSPEGREHREAMLPVAIEEAKGLARDGLGLMAKHGVG